MSKWNNCAIPPLGWKVWQELDGGPSLFANLTETAFGAATVRLEATFTPYMGGASYTVVQTVDVSISPPDAIILNDDPSPLNVDVQPVLNPPGQATFPVKFYVRGDGRTLNVMGAVYEGIVRKPGYANPANLANLPYGVQTGIKFTAPGEITDMKGVFVDFLIRFQNWPMNFVIDEFDQTIGMDLESGCDGTVPFVLGSFHFKQVKTGNNAWQLQLL